MIYLNQVVQAAIIILRTKEIFTYFTSLLQTENAPKKN